MSDYPVKVQILNISMNLSRMGEWMAIDFVGKKKLIDRFRLQTDELIHQASVSGLETSFLQTWRDFEAHYKQIEFGSKNRLLNSERLLAWANVLQHRVSLLDAN